MVQHGDRASWLAEIWLALDDWREANPEGDAANDARWDEICTAMAWTAETLGVSETEDLLP